MKALQHQGILPGALGLGTYQYAVGVDAGRRFVVFQQTADRTKTSITNLIEGLASQVLATDLAGVEPGLVDFYEFYPPHMSPIQEWQKVTFAEVGPVRNPPRGMLERIIRFALGLFGIEGKPDAWAVAKPQWEAMHPSKVSPEVKAAVR